MAVCNNSRLCAIQFWDIIILAGSKLCIFAVYLLEFAKKFKQIFIRLYMPQNCGAFLFPSLIVRTVFGNRLQKVLSELLDHLETSSVFYSRVVYDLLKHLFWTLFFGLVEDTTARHIHSVDW